MTNGRTQVRPFTIEYIIETNPISPQAIASGLYTKPLTDKETLIYNSMTL